MDLDSHPLFDETSLDLAGMRRTSYARVCEQMNAQGLGALWLSSPGNIRYLAGSCLLPADAGHATFGRATLLVDPRQEYPHLLTPDPASAPPELPPEYVHPPLFLESEVGIVQALRILRELLGSPPDGAFGIDEHSPALFFHLQRNPEALGAPTRDAGPVLAAAKLCKSETEIECIRRAQSINERAMAHVQQALRPGLRQSDLSALFFGHVYALGASANGIDPIWQVMPPTIAEGPFTTHGDVAFPTTTTDRILRQDDVIWVDSGIDYQGYQSDFGRTFKVGSAPTKIQHDQGRRWLDVINAVLEQIRPGVRGSELLQVATEVAGHKPWLSHFYLIHGVGTEPAEQPLLGTDLGPVFDETMVLAEGMVLVLEPTIWDDGHCGYRAEEIVTVTGDGYRLLSSYPYAPYDHKPLDPACGSSSSN